MSSCAELGDRQRPATSYGSPFSVISQLSQPHFTLAVSYRRWSADRLVLRTRLGRCDDRMMAVDRQAAIVTPQSDRRALFDLLADEAYYSQPIALRHPIVFYEGHLPGFSFNTLVKKGLGGPSIDARLEALFARGIDPHETAGRRSAGRSAASVGMARARRRLVARSSRARSRRAGDRRAANGDLDRPGPSAARSRRGGVHASSSTRRCTRRRCSTCGIACRSSRKRRPAGYAPRVDGAAPRERMDRGSRRAAPRSASTAPRCRSAGTTSFRRCAADVPAFSIERHDVTNAHFLEFVDAGGYDDAAVVAAGGLGVGAARARSRIRCSGSVDDGAWLLARHVRPDPAAARRGPSMSARPKRRRTRAGAARACRPKPSFSAPRSASPARRAARIPWGDARADADARRVRLLQLGSRAGRQPSRRARAPGASRISSATAGSGRARCSRRFPASGRWRRIRNTRPISSTASTSS